MSASPYLTEDDDEDYTEDEQHDNELKLAVTGGLAQNSLPHRPRHTASTHPLQERSSSIQVDTIVRPRGPLLKQEFPCFYGQGPETKLTNRSGDHVLIHAQFYQLTPVQYQNYNSLRIAAFKVPKYFKYREKQHKGGKPKGNQDVWGDIREELFFKALVKFPPMWREQRPYPPYETPNKPYGRNEHIAFYINDILGAPRPPPKVKDALPGQTIRKQVSSHLQVLKGYFANRPDLLIWLGSEQKSKEDKPKRTGLTANDRAARRRPPYQLRRAYSASSKSLPDPLAILPSQISHAAPAILSAPAKFSMSLRTESTKVHTFAEWQKLDADDYDLRFFDRAHWTQTFPQLETVMAEVPADCRYIFAECMLNLADGDLVLANKILEFDYAYVCGSSVRKADTFDVNTRFLDGITTVSEAQQDCTADRMTGNLDVGFFSKHWLQVLQNFCQHLKAAADRPPGSLQEPEYLRKTHLNKAKKELERQLQNMSAIQKITHHTINDLDVKTDNVVLVVYWKFGLAGQGAKGTTSFRNLILPAQRPLADVWLRQDQMHQALRDESSFAIKDETSTFDSPYTNMPYNYDVKVDEEAGYPYNSLSHSSAFHISQSYNFDDYSAERFYDTRLYNAALATEFLQPADAISTKSEEGGIEMGDLTRVPDVDMSMFDYSSLPSSLDSHTAHGPLLGPGDGLAGLGLGLANQLQLDAFDPVLVGDTTTNENSHHLQHGHFPQLVDNAQHGFESSYPVNNAIADYQMQQALLEQQNKPRLLPAEQEQDSVTGNPIKIIGPFAQRSYVEQEPTHFHHYHRRQPRLHLHPSSATTHHNSGLHSPVDHTTPNLVLGQSWYPADHYADSNQHDSSLHHPSTMPPTLARMDSDATIDANMSDHEDLSQGSGRDSAGYSQETVYSQETAYSQEAHYTQDKDYLHHPVDDMPIESFRQSFHHDAYISHDDVPRHLAIAELEGDHHMDQGHHEQDNHLYGLAAVSAATADFADGDWEMLHAPQEEGKENYAPAVRDAGALLSGPTN